MFCCEFRKIVKNTFFIEHFQWSFLLKRIYEMNTCLNKEILFDGRYGEPLFIYLRFAGMTIIDVYYKKGDK